MTRAGCKVAFISYVVGKSGYGDRFPYFEAHWKYINEAITKRQAGDEQASFWGFRLSEHRPRLGDLVAMWRVSKVTFDNRPSKFFASHCEVVVEVTESRTSGSLRKLVRLTEKVVLVGGSATERRIAEACH
jgi:hypothetical protein